MKVAELEGAQLDYWVAKAEGAQINDESTRIGATVFCGTERPSFSTRWDMAGPIIDREQIQITPQGGYWVATVFLMVYGHQPKYFAAPTPLVAAMRAYVASKFGDEVKDS